MIFNYDIVETDYLKEKDAILGEVIEKFGHIERTVDEDIFSSVVLSIIAQQISNSAYNTVRKRLIDAIGTINSENIISLGRDRIKSFGISYRKADCILDFAHKVHIGEFDINGLYDKSDDEVIKELSALRGVGSWTAEMIMIFSLQRKNILSYSDFGIKKGLCMLYGLDKIDKSTFEIYKEKFSPYCTVASFYLWATANQTNKAITQYAIYKTKYGNIKIGYTKEHIVYSGFTKEETDGTTSKLSDLAFSQILEYMCGERTSFDLPTKAKGTVFQQSVWNELCKIPYGETRSYKDIAIAIGNSKACRAVGMANNKNPLGIIVPCHRVNGANGSLTGYAGGLDIKQLLLSLEQTYTKK